MAGLNTAPLLAVLCILLSLLPATVAQAPSDDTLPPSAGYNSLVSTQDGMSNNFRLYPLTDSAKLGEVPFPPPNWYRYSDQICAGAD